MSRARAWKVKIRLLDAVGQKLNEVPVDCRGENPGAACNEAFAVAGSDFRSAAGDAKVHAVQFLVMAAKRSK